MKSWVKITTIATACLIPVAFVIGFATDWTRKTPISCVGSSGVKPFVEEFAKEFNKQNKKLDVTVDAGGSGFGISQIANRYCNIGDASKNPFSVVKENEKYKEAWERYQIKTITIGWEAICVVWIPPKDLGISGEGLNSLLSINQSNVDNLMRVFSGYKDGLNNVKGTLGDFVANNIPNGDIKGKLDKTEIIPYVRAGGATTSGTAASFYQDTHFSLTSPLTSRQKNALESGTYGNEFNIQDTDEPNSQAWKIFSQNNIPGSMVYLSSGFVKPNKKLIEKSGYGIMEYNTTLFDYDMEHMGSTGYDWIRPLNVIISLSTITDYEKIFIESFFDNEDQLKKIGGIPLTNSQKQSMKFGILGEQWWEWSDLRIVEETPGWSWNANSNTTFGAIE